MGAFPHRPPLQDPWPRPSKLHKRGPAPQSHAAKNQTVRTCCTDARRNSDGTTKEILFVLPGPTRPDPSPIMRRRESDQHTQMDRKTPERNNHTTEIHYHIYIHEPTDHVSIQIRSFIASQHLVTSPFIRSQHCMRNCGRTSSAQAVGAITPKFM